MTTDKNIIILKAQLRKEKGKKNKNLRDKNKIPAITYGSKVKNLPLSLDLKEFQKVYDEAGESTLVDLKIGDEPTKKILISETQFHPLSGLPIHVDLYQVRMDEKIKTEIPLKFIGESKAVKDLDGTLNTVKDEVEVECLPANLISEIEVDISSLNTFEDVIYIKNLPVPDSITILDDKEEVIAQVEEPRSEEELAELEEKVEEQVEDVEVDSKKEDQEEVEAEEGEEKGEETKDKEEVKIEDNKKDQEQK
ncbi:50S ribosomal protein L25 [Patescibacteria group bacterium]